MKAPLVFLLLIARTANAAPPGTPAELFQTEQVWTVHLQFQADQWAAIDPKGGELPFWMRGPSWSGGFGVGDLLARLGNRMRGPGPGEPIGFVAPKGKRNGLSGVMGIDFENVHATLEFDGRTFRDVAVRYKGNGSFMQSRGKEKKSFKVDLDEYVKGQKLAGVTKLNLHSGVTDASLMNEVLAYRLYRDAGVAAPRSAYARVYISVPGKYEKKYFGLYSLIEEVDGNFAEENYKTRDGRFLKPATRDIFGYLGEDWEPYELPYAPKGKLAAAWKKRVIDFARLLTKGTEEEFRAQAPEYLDVAQMARYMAVTTWIATLDSILATGQNYFVYLNPKSNRMELLPWDLDVSFGQFVMDGTQEQREQLSIRRPWRGQIRFLERLYGLPEFQKEYFGKLAEFQGTLFVPSRFAGQVDALAKALRPAVAAEPAETLARFDKVVAGEAVPAAAMGFGPPPGAIPPPGGAFIEVGAPVKPIKGFVGPRARSVADQLAGRSEGMVRGPGLGLPRMDQLDADKNGSISLAEGKAGLAKWFRSWNTSR